MHECGDGGPGMKPGDDVHEPYWVKPFEWAHVDDLHALNAYILLKTALTL